MPRPIPSALTLAAVGCWLLASACSESDSTKGMRQRGANQVQLPPTPRPPSAAVEPSATSAPNPLPEPSAAAPEPEKQPEDKKPPRDMPRELLTLMGSPASCLGPRPATSAPSSVDIGLSASVMPSGSVGRAEVTGPNLSDDERKCLRTRLEGLRFATPIENAPTNVSATLTLKQSPGT